MNAEKRGWSVLDWCGATSIGRTKTFELIANGDISSVTAGRRRIITTSPADYLSSLTAQTPVSLRSRDAR